MSYRQFVPCTIPLCYTALIQGSCQTPVAKTKLIHCGIRALGASTTTPLLELGGHSHWVWQAKYNPHHDSLLLSASSDSLVNLWHTPITAGGSSIRGQGASKGGVGVSSQTGQKGFAKETQDGKACTYDDHEDSVYGRQHHAITGFSFMWQLAVIGLRSYIVTWVPKSSAILQN